MNCQMDPALAQMLREIIRQLDELDKRLNRTNLRITQIEHYILYLQEQDILPR
ncbi:hypothetical protein BpJC7_06890 [Weizmannia acidilactici]|uniref:Uncharacterized protein n=1 Tax=Weizmannia acidilactici TaxID=2607726 RepID=A0A5J4J346_9BACI|nr:hypothetical protein [Weizmannia acidilactici]GER66468.1 hypothetical protein BpJC4_09390 [Weizmannia acidilactici]GER69386.1 hypothetical protein BpJC7_06890 [Weizmannia acidilactici]GER72286.1 hypothetical protein BpPP18_03530 [Weizmannia acidilactici]